MNSKDEPESKSFQHGELTPRLMRQIKGQNDNLYKEYTKLQEKLSKSKESISKLQIQNASLEKELTLTKANQKKLNSQKQALEKELQELKEYSRKLEQKISIGAKGQGIVEINISLQNKVQEAKLEKISHCNRISELEAELEKANKDIEELRYLCEVKAEEIGIKGEDPQVILYRIAMVNKENSQIKAILGENKSKYEKLCEKVEELQIIRESNNEELNRLEEENYKMGCEKEELVKCNKELALDRGALMQCLEEMTAQEKQYEMDIEYFNKQMEVASLEYNEKIMELQRELELKDQIIKVKSQQRNSEPMFKEKLEELESLKEKLKSFNEFEKENVNLRSKINKQLIELEEVKKEAEFREKKLKGKLAMCFKELENLVNEKEEMQVALNVAVNKCTQKMTVEDRPRQTDDTLDLLNQAKKKNLEILRMIS